MAYRISSVSKRVLNYYIKKGKEKTLTTPDYVPPAQRPMEFVVILCLLGSIPVWFWLGWPFGGGLLLAAGLLFGIRDVFIQNDHTITRIYGPLGRLRYMFENVFRDKYLQYFNETNTDGRPMPKIVRDYVYQKAKGLKSMSSFGTELDIYDAENTSNTRILHSNFGGQPEVDYGFQVGEHRPEIQPFQVKNCVNISAMSYGSLNYKAAECLSSFN